MTDGDRERCIHRAETTEYLQHLPNADAKTHVFGNCELSSHEATAKASRDGEALEALGSREAEREGPWTREPIGSRPERPIE